MVGLGWWGKTLVESVDGSDAIRFVAATTRTVTPSVEEAATSRGLRLVPSYDELLADPGVDAVVLATPPSVHTEQVVAAAAAGKHVFCEKPFTLTRAEAEQAAEACDRAEVALGLGYNRRFHPEMAKLRERARSGELGTIMHAEATMTFPNALTLQPSQWRARRDEAPCGGLTPLGVHAVDGMIDLCGDIAEVYCQSFRRVVEIDNDDTTSMLFRMRDGSSGYLGTLTATGPGFSFQLFGSAGWVQARGHDARRRCVVRGAAHRALRHVQVPACGRCGGDVGGGEVRHLAGGPGGVRGRRRRWAGVPHPRRGDGARRRRHRSDRALRRHRCGRARHLTGGTWISATASAI